MSIDVPSIVTTVLIGTVAAGGWLVDRQHNDLILNTAADSAAAQRITAIEATMAAKHESIETDVREIKEALIRMEEHILELRK